MGGTVSACAGNSGLCAGKEKKKGKKEFKPEKYPKKRKRWEKQLKEKVQAQDVAGLKVTAGHLTDKLSQHDADLVDGKIRESESRQSGLLSSIDHKLQGYGQLETDLASLRTQAQTYMDWLDQCEAKVKDAEGEGHSLQHLEARLEELKALEQELSTKQTSLDSVSDNVHAILADLPTSERRDLEQLLATVQSRQNEIVGQVSEQCRQLEETTDQAREVLERLDQHRTWLLDTQPTTDQYDVIRLAATDVAKQLDQCKVAVSKAHTKTERLNEIGTKVAALEEIDSCSAKEDLAQTVEELSALQDRLASKLTQQQSNLRDCLASRNKFETDCAKIDRWAADTELKTGQDSEGMQDLEERLEELKNLSNSVQVFDSLLKETVELGESFYPSLDPTEHATLTAQLEALQHRFSRASKQVQSSTEALQAKLASQTETQGQINQCENFLQAVQGEIKKASRPIGFDTADAQLMQAVFQSLEEKLSSYSPTLDHLKETSEKLTEKGRVALTDDITRLSDLHQSLTDQVKVQLDTCAAAVSQRQVFGQLLDAQDRLVSECEASAAQTAKQPVQERLQLYKSVLDKLLQLEPDLPITAEKAAHIGTQGTQDDVATATATVEKLATKLHAQKASVQAQLAQCEAMQREKEGFESSINSLMTWLEEKEPALASCNELRLDAAKVTPVIAKHKVTSAEAQEKIKTIKDQALAERNRYEALSESLPADVSDRLQQIEALEESITSAISKKEQYLNEALTDRHQLENSLAQVSDWLRGASDMLDSGVSGLDYDTLDNTLSEFTDYFTEASLCQDELEQVTELSERLLPTLDSNDAATLEQTLSGMQRKYTHVMSGAHSRQAQLEQKVQQWNSFQDQLAAANGRLDVLEGEWQEVDHSADASPDAVHSHLELVKTFVEHAETSRSMMDSLNEVARDLERSGSQDSRASIAHLVQSVNERWEALTGQAEARVMTLEDIGGQWGDFTSMLSAVQTVVQESETRLAIMAVDEVTLTQLVNQLQDLKEIGTNLERMEPQVSRLQTSSMTLQRALPTAEAKITSQEQFMVLVEKYETLVKQVKEVTSAVQEEADTRQSAIEDLEQCSDWLRETLTSLQPYSEASGSVDERSSRNKLAQAELKHRMEGVTSLVASLESLYGAGGRELPEELRAKVTEVRNLDQEVEQALREEEEKLGQLRDDRTEFRKLLADVSGWLHRADVQLQDRLTALPQAREEHQNLLGDFDTFKADLDRLRSKGGEIIRDTPDPDEKQTTQRALAEVNRQWLSLQAAAAGRTAALSEATDLTHAIEDVSCGVDTWLAQAQELVQADLQWTQPDRLKEQLAGHRQVVKEVPGNQDKVTALGAMVKQLEQTCPAPSSQARVASLKQKLDTVQTKAGVQLSALEDANQRLTDFEREVSELMRWLEQTRARMTMRDTTSDLRTQLDVQEKVYRFMLTCYEPEVK